MLPIFVQPAHPISKGSFAGKWKRGVYVIRTEWTIIRDMNLPSQNVARRIGMAPVDSWIKHYRGIDMPHDRFVVTR